MAATLTDAGELTYLSFGIDKIESTPDGDLLCFGRATDGSVDHDEQIVDPQFSSKAISEWLTTGGNVRVQHNAQRDPAGVGVEVNTDSSGATWVKSLIIEPIAKKLLSAGALRAYSIGIARPTIVRDTVAKGGRITDGKIVEISLVDRPANARCGIQLVKSASDGTAEFVEKVFGDDDVIAKFAGPDLVKGGNGSNTDTFTLPQEDMSLTFTPSDLAKILKSKIIDAHYDELALKALYDAEAEIYKRDVNTAERRSLASQGNALSNGSYPIANTGDLGNAAHLAATGHGDVEGAKKLIARRAKELGVANPLDSDESKTERGSVENATAELIKTDDVVEPVIKEAEPEIVKDPEDTEATDEPGNAKAAKPKKGGKKMPPWLNKPDSDDGPSDDGDDDSCKMDHAHSEKCSGTPKSASGAADAADMQEIPNTGPALESPMPAGRKTPDTKALGSNPEASAMMRFKTIGIDADLGRLHDLTCPAYSPEDVAKYHPYASFADLIDLDIWQRKAVDSACGPLGKAMELTKVWEAAQVLKDYNPAELNDFRLEAHKAFRDANPGVSSYPSPGAMSPSKYNRGVITAGHEANSTGYDGPNSSPAVASSPASAGNYDRPPLSAGHQSPSPSHMKNDTEYPSQQGVPANLTYMHLEKEKARRSLNMMHDHLSHQFPQACPMLDQDAYSQPVARPLPATEGLGKAVTPEQEVAAVSKAPGIPQEVLDSIEKGMKRKLGKKVLAGRMTVDEARSKIGRMRAQKMEEWQLEDQLTKGIITREDAMKALGFEVPEAVKSTEPEIIKSPTGDAPAPYFMSPDVIKSAIADAIAPLLTKIAQQDDILTKAQQTISEQEARWEAKADEPDPSTSSWRGLALKSARPVGVAKQAEIAERTQHMIDRQLNHVWRTSENPFEREAARSELDKRGFAE